METARKITIEVSPELLEKAQRATGSGITQTVRTGPAAGRGVPGLCGTAPTPRQGSFLSHSGGAEGGSLIAVDTSTWIAFVQGASGKASFRGFTDPSRAAAGRH